MNEKPTAMNATKPRPKIVKFVMTTWAACFARQKPVSTSAKPACMKTTRAAPITIQRRFSEISPWVRDPSVVAGVPPPVMLSAHAVPPPATARAAPVARMPHAVKNRCLTEPPSRPNRRRGRR